MMARYASEAERLRAHREAFALSLRLGCTPREAEQQLRRRRCAAASKEAGRRLQAKLHPASDAVCSRPFDEWDATWMMRD